MATLEISTWFVADGGKTPNTEAGEKTVYMCSGTAPIGASTGHVAGNIGARVPPIGEHSIDLNFPRAVGTISVTSYRPSTFSSTDLSSQPSLAGQMSTLIEKSLVRVEDQAFPGVYLTRTDLNAYV